MLTRLYEDELKYKNLSTKISTFHVSKIKIYLFFKTEFWQFTYSFGCLLIKIVTI